MEKMAGKEKTQKEKEIYWEKGRKKKKVIKLKNYEYEIFVMIFLCLSV